MIPRPRVPDLLALAACVLIAFLVLYNALFHVTTHLTTDPTLGISTDYFHFHWNFWWIRHALANGMNIYETNYIFSPFTSNLAFHTLSLFWFPLWTLIEPVTGTVAAMTAVFFVAFVLVGWTSYLLFRDLGIAPFLSLLGGVTLELSSLMIAGVRWTNINLMAWFWLPILLLTWRQLLRATSTRIRLAYALALGAAVWAMILTDLQYPLFVSFIVIPYGMWTLWRAPKQRLSLIALVGVALITALVLLWVAGPLRAILAFDYTGLSPTPVDRAPPIQFPTCFLWNCNSGISASIITLPAFVAALIVSIRLSRRRMTRSLNPERWLWALMVPIPLILAMGSSIEIGGQRIVMPYVLLHELLGGMFRYPERFLPMFSLPALIFAFMTFSPLLQHDHRGKPFFYGGVFLLVIANAQIFDPLPLTPIPKSYSAYEMIGREPYDGVVVEIPTAGSSGEGSVGDSRAAALEYYGIVHGKRMVNGHISRVNTYDYFYMNTADPMMAWLGQRRFLEPENVAQEMRDRIPAWPIGYFMVHRDLIAPDQSAINEIVSFFNAHEDLVCPLLTEGDLVVYRTRGHPDGCPPLLPDETAPDTYQIDMGTVGNAQDDALFIGEGWYYPESIFDTTIRWAGAQEAAAETASIYTDLPPDACTLTLTAQAFYEPRTVTVSVNGTTVGDPLVISPNGLGNYSVAIPAEVIGDGQHVRVTLAFDARRTPSEVGQGEGDRTLAIMVDKMTFTASTRSPA